MPCSMSYSTRPLMSASQSAPTILAVPSTNSTAAVVEEQQRHPAKSGQPKKHSSALNGGGGNVSHGFSLKELLSLGERICMAQLVKPAEDLSTVALKGQNHVPVLQRPTRQPPSPGPVWRKSGGPMVLRAVAHHDHWRPAG